MSDKIIQFPGFAGRPSAPLPTPAPKPAPPAPEAATPAPADAEQIRQAQAALGNLSAEQQKAMQIVLSGMSFVLVGIQPSERGADFFTALHGEAADLRNAQPHLGGVIDRAYSRKGV